MEVMLCVPQGTNISVIVNEYPDIYKDDGYDDHDRYFIGNPTEDENGDLWMTYDECVQFCGFSEGAIEGANALIDGNGEWAQGKVTETELYKIEYSRGIKLRR